MKKTKHFLNCLKNAFFGNFLHVFFFREEAEDSVAALSSRVEVLTRRKEKLEAALEQVQIER